MPTILHTADWHLGKRLRSFRLIEEQREALERLVEIAAEERPDLVLVAGDLFDAPVPPIDALRAWERVTARLIDDLGIPIIAIPGNHDAADRVALNAGRARDAGLVVVHTLEQALRPVVLGGVQVTAVPYHGPAQVRAWLAGGGGGADTGSDTGADADSGAGSASDDAEGAHAATDGPRDADAAMAAVLDRARTNLAPDLPSILLAHAFVEGAGEEDDGEEPLVVGGAGGVRPATLHGFDYVALGHLHGPRAVGPGDRMRYAGSLYPYAFGEPNAKSVTRVRITGAGEHATVEAHPRELPVGRAVRLIEGVTFDGALAAGAAAHEEMRADDYLLLRVTDREPIDHALARLREVFPNALLEQPAIEVLERFTGLQAPSDGRPLDPETAFLAFYRHVFGAEPSDVEAEILREALEAPEAPEAPE